MRLDFGLGLGVGSSLTRDTSPVRVRACEWSWCERGRRGAVEARTCSSPVPSHRVRRQSGHPRRRPLALKSVPPGRWTCWHDGCCSGASGPPVSLTCSSQGAVPTVAEQRTVLSVARREAYLETGGMPCGRTRDGQCAPDLRPRAPDTDDSCDQQSARCARQVWMVPGLPVRDAMLSEG